MSRWTSARIFAISRIFIIWPTSFPDFDPATASGKITWQRAAYSTRQAFDNMLAVINPVEPNEFPGIEYEANPTLPFRLEFVSPNTVRICLQTGPELKPETESLMLVGGKAPKDNSWKYGKIEGGHRYTSACGSVTVLEKPWHMEFRDAKGRLLTKTNHLSDNKATFTPILPFSFVRRASDYSRSVAAVFSLSPDEKIFGCGESFTRLDKRGQKVVLWTDDANGVENQDMYKPIPFFMSSRGYGMFMHTSSPITCDFGSYFSGINSLMLGDDELDLFVFLGTPKEILDSYTNLTGKPAMPPLWSFGLWMSRITYISEDQVRNVAAKLRQNRIPSDVIHLDTGWFETDWRCDYEFSTSRFKDPQKMIADLKKDGFHISLWQLPYFVPKNTLFQEILEKGSVCPRCQRQPALRRRGAGFFQSGHCDVVSGENCQPAEHGRGRDQGRFRRGRSGQWIICLGTDRFLRTQPLPPSLQQNSGRYHPAGHRREHNLGTQHLGRQPAISAALGRRCGEHRYRAWRPRCAAVCRSG